MACGHYWKKDVTSHGITYALCSPGSECPACLRAELSLARGAMRASDERLERAAVQVWGEDLHGCDTAEWLADEILGLRSALAACEAERKRERIGHLRRMADYADSHHWIGMVPARLDRFRDACRAAIERERGA